MSIPIGIPLEQDVRSHWTGLYACLDLDQSIFAPRRIDAQSAAARRGVGHCACGIDGCACRVPV